MLSTATAEQRERRWQPLRLQEPQQQNADSGGGSGGGDSSAPGELFLIAAATQKA